MNRPDLLLCVALAAAACGNDDAQLASSDGNYRVLHIADAQWDGARARTEMDAVLERLPQFDLVYGHNDPMAKAAFDACKQKGRSGVKFVGIDGLPGEGRRYVLDGILDATFEYPTCAEAAIDLLLLACNGVPLNKEIGLGTRLYARASTAVEGKPSLLAGDFYLVSLRRQHQDGALSTEPKTDRRFLLGMAQCNDGEPWRQAMREAMQAWAKRYPQVEFHYRAADNDTEKQRSIVRDFIAQNFNGILVSPKESLALAAPCKEAMQRGIPVIVIDRRLGSDDFTCFIGGDNKAIGRAAGEEIRRLLPGGGTIVELQGLMTSSPAQERHQGFVEALQLAPPK